MMAPWAIKQETSMDDIVGYVLCNSVFAELELFDGQLDWQLFLSDQVMQSSRDTQCIERDYQLWYAGSWMYINEINNEIN